MGGLTAEHVAVLHAWVTRLVLAATGPGRHAAAAAAPRRPGHCWGAARPRRRRAYRLACTVLYSPRFQRDHPEFIEDEVATGRRHPIPGRAFTAQFRSSRDADIAQPPAGEIAVPALVLHGTEDVLVPLANAETLTKLIPAPALLVRRLRPSLLPRGPGRTVQVMLSFLRGG